MGERLMSLLHAYQILLQFFHPKFLVTLIAKPTMNRAKLGFFAVEIYFRGSYLKEIVRQPQNRIGEEKDVVADEKKQIYHILREAVRAAFIFFIQEELVSRSRYLSNHHSVDLDFFVKEYALELFPPLPAPKEFRESDAQEGGYCREDSREDTFVHQWPHLLIELSKTDPELFQQTVDEINLYIYRKPTRSNP